MKINEENTGPKITPTVEWIREHYEKANRELFRGELGECYFEAKPITSHSYWLGAFSMKCQSLCVKRYNRNMYVKHSCLNGDVTYITKENFFNICKPTITLNTMYLGTEFSLYLTLVHEMCHYYTYMYGYCPRQAHGVEFRNIGAEVAYRSGGVITVQRIASAEAMEGYELTDEIKQKKERLKQNKIKKCNYFLIADESENFRLVNLASIDAARDLYKKYDSDKFVIIEITNDEVKEKLFNLGYKKLARYYHWYWSMKPTDSGYSVLKQVYDDV